MCFIKIRDSFWLGLFIFILSMVHKFQQPVLRFRHNFVLHVNEILFLNTFIYLRFLTVVTLLCVSVSLWFIILVYQCFSDVSSVILNVYNSSFTRCYKFLIAVSVNGIKRYIFFKSFRVGSHFTNVSNRTNSQNGSIFLNFRIVNFLTLKTIVKVKQ